MDSYGFLWILTDSCGFLRVLEHLHSVFGPWCLWRVLSGSLHLNKAWTILWIRRWASAVWGQFQDNLWDSYGFLWVLVGSCGFLSIFKVSLAMHGDSFQDSRPIWRVLSGSLHLNKTWTILWIRRLASASVWDQFQDNLWDSFQDSWRFWFVFQRGISLLRVLRGSYWESLEELVEMLQVSIKIVVISANSKWSFEFFCGWLRVTKVSTFFTENHLLYSWRIFDGFFETVEASWEMLGELRSSLKLNATIDPFKKILTTLSWKICLWSVSRVSDLLQFLLDSFVNSCRWFWKAS